MKKIYLLAALFPIIGIGQNVSVIALKSNDLAYSAATNKIYVSVKAENPTNGSSIGIINPQTALMESSFSVGTEPSVLRIAADGNVMYSGFLISPEIKKINLFTQSVSTTIALGSNTETGNYLAEDIVILPGENTIAVSRKNRNFAPRHEGVAIFENGVGRTTASKNHTGANQIEWLSTGQLLGFNNETTEYGIRKMTVGADGIANTQTANVEAINGNLTFAIHDDIAFFSNGKALQNLAVDPVVAGTFENAFGPVVYDQSANLVCYASNNLLGGISLNRYNPTDFTLVDSHPITQVTGIVKSIVACGNGCYAMNTADQVIVVNNVLATNPFSKIDRVSIYPNPAQDLLNVRSGMDVTKVVFYSTIGQMAKTISGFEKGTHVIDVSGLHSGTYIVKMTTENETFTQKLIKL